MFAALLTVLLACGSGPGSLDLHPADGPLAGQRLPLTGVVAHGVDDGMMEYNYGKDFSPEELAARWTKALEADGWSVTAMHQLPGGAHAVLFNKAAEQLSVMFAMEHGEGKAYVDLDQD